MGKGNRIKINDLKTILMSLTPYIMKSTLNPPWKEQQTTYNIIPPQLNPRVLERPYLGCSM